MRAGLAVLFGTATLLAQAPNFGGPGVLSRGGGGGVTPAVPIAFRPFVNVSGGYTNGLAGASVGPDGKLVNQSAAGGEIAAGIYGYHSWKHTVVGLNYRGDYRRYSNAGAYNGTNQFLSFGVTHQLSPKVAFTLRQGAGTLNQTQGYLGSFGFFDPTFAQIPRDEMLDTRTDYFTTMGDVTLLKSPRLSFNLGGTAFTVRRRLSALYGVTGASARGDAAYRVTRRTTLAMDYFFSRFSFNQAFGDAYLHSVGWNYSIQFSRWWQLGFRVGALRMEMQSLGRVRLDPLVAAILGRSEGIRTVHKVETTPAYSAQLSRRFRHGTAGISAQYGASPGNGVYLTSRHNVVAGDYAYTGMRRWSMSVRASYSDMRSVGQDIGRYESVSAGASVTRALGDRNLFLTFRCDARNVSSGNTYHRTYYTALVGVAYSPGDIPLRLW